EGQSSGTLVGTFSAYDEDQFDTQTYTLVNGEGDSGNPHFYIDGANLLALTTFDYSITNLYSIRVQVSDSGGLTDTGIFDISIYPTNSVGEADLDGDGISDWWEASFTEITDLDPNLDTDGDGIVNMNEWIAGTDPTDAGAIFEIAENIKDQQSGHSVLKWRGRPDRTYSVYWSTNLLESMQLIQSGIPSTPPWNTYTDTVHNAENEGFYRLKVEHAQ
ncbi:MAG TPA: cadherin repeat domain-containing protein, partial [Pontiella sp.]